MPDDVTNETDVTNLEGMTLDQLDAIARGETPPVASAADPAPAATAAPTVPAEPVVPAAPAAAAPAPAVTTPAAPAAVATAGEDDDPEPTDPKATVPYQRFQRERKKNRDRIAALEKANADLNEKFARGDERARMLAELVATPEAAPAEAAAPEDLEPDPAQDVIAWAQWSKREIGRLKEGVTRTSDTVAETAASQRMREDYQADAMSFAQQNPDFGVAYNHLLQTRGAMLAGQGYSEKEIRSILVNEERALVERAFKTGKRPAELVYGLAQSLGYRKAAAAAAAPAPAVAPAAAPAAPAAPVTPAAPAPSVTEEVERIARGVDSSKTLSGGGGAPQDLSIEALATMTDREFQALYAKRKGDVDALMGKRAH